MELLFWLTFLTVTTASSSLALNVPLVADRVMNVSSLLLQESTLPIGITAIIRDENGPIASISAQLRPGVSFVKLYGQGNYVPQYVLDLDIAVTRFYNTSNYPAPQPPPFPSPSPPRPPLPPGPSFTIIDFTQMATAPSIISLYAGQDLTLASLSLYLVGVSDALGVDDDAQPSNLALSNKVISVPHNATLRLQNVTVVFKKSEFWKFLSNNLCSNATSWPYTPGVELNRNGIHISSLTTYAPDDEGKRGKGGTVEWRDVKLTFSDGGYYGSIPCAAFTVSDGSELLRVTRELQDMSFASVAKVYISLTANITLPQVGNSVQPISLKGPSPMLVLLGNPKTTSILDLAGRADVWVARDVYWPESNLTAVATVAMMYDLTLVNLPYPARARPNGTRNLLTSGLHSFVIRRDSYEAGSSNPYLAVERCTLVVPDPEVEFLREALRNATSAVKRWFSSTVLFKLLQPSGDTTAIEGQLLVTSMQLLMEVGLSNCVLLSTSRYSVLPDSVPLLPQSRLWLPQLLAATNEDWYGQLGPGGLGFFYGIEGALRDAQNYGTSLGYTTRLISRRLDNSTLGYNVSALKLSLSATDPEPLDSVSAPARCVFDSFPEEALGGRVFVDLQGVFGRVQLARPITLQNLVLYNLAVGGMYPLAAGMAPRLTGTDAAWIGSTLPLWFFNFDRSALDLPKGAMSSPDDDVPSTTTARTLTSSSLLQLVNVTLVVQEPEWRALVATILSQHVPAAMKAAQNQWQSGGYEGGQDGGSRPPPTAPAYTYNIPPGGAGLTRIVLSTGGEGQVVRNQRTRLRRQTAEQQTRLESNQWSSPHGRQRRTQALPGGTAPPSPMPPNRKLRLYFSPSPYPPAPSPPAPEPPSPPPSPPYTETTQFALRAFAAASRIRAYNFTSGVLVLDTATHYGWTGTNITFTRAMPPDAPEGAVLLSYPNFELPYSSALTENINLDVQVNFPPPPLPPSLPSPPSLPPSLPSPAPRPPSLPSPPPADFAQSPPAPFSPLQAVRPSVAPLLRSPLGPKKPFLSNTPVPTLTRAPTPDQGPSVADARHTSGRPSWVVPLSATLSSTFGILLVACVLLVKIRAHRKQGGSQDKAAENGAEAPTEDDGILCRSVRVRLDPFSAADCKGTEFSGRTDSGGRANNRRDAVMNSISGLTIPITGGNMEEKAPAIKEAVISYTQSASLDITAEDGTIPKACGYSSKSAAPAESTPDDAAAAEDTTSTATLDVGIPASVGDAEEKGGHQIDVHRVLDSWLDSKTISTLPPASISFDIGKGSRDWKCVQGNRDAVTHVVTMLRRHNTNKKTQLKPADLATKIGTGLGEFGMAAALPLAHQLPEDSTVFHLELQAYYQELMMKHAQEKQPLKPDPETTPERQVAPAEELPAVLKPRNASWASGIQFNGIQAMKKSIRNLQGKLNDEGLQIYNIIDMGSYGVVYRAKWRGLAVAVKTLVVAEGSGVPRHRAVLEAAISLSMAHPHVLATYAYDIKPLVHQPQPGPLQNTCDDLIAKHNLGSCDAFKLYIVQEYCNGGTLQQALECGMAGSVRAGGLPRVLALRLALDIALGLRHIHDCRIVHGDLKPENVLLSLNAMGDSTETSLEPLSPTLPAITAKVADFGLSLPLRDSVTHASGRFQGTPAYMAPEVFTLGKLSPSSDVWSLGLLLVELYYGCTLAEIATIHSQVSGVLSSVSMQPPVDLLLQDMLALSLGSYASLVAACLSQEPHARPTVAEVVSHLQGMFHNAQ